MYNKSDALAKYAMRHQDKSEIFHSSGYGVVQNGNNIGVAEGAETYATRRTLDAHRKFVRGYNNSRIIRGAYSVERARAVQAGENTTDIRRKKGEGMARGTIGGGTERAQMGRAEVKAPVVLPRR